MGRVGVRVSPRAARSEIVGRHGDAWRIRVAAPPELGRATVELLELLASVLDVPRRRVGLVAGRSARDKVIEVEGMARDEMERRLAARRRKGTT